ncbi:MAG: DUF2865 domain-containing protein [Bradyrhizobiaceae bacterium]|nr:MAG: DUF2865 domain-containing protein [Bradyrhizobiaceae bacterium]
MTGIGLTNRFVGTAAVAALLAFGSLPAHAGDFFSSLFGVFGAAPPSPPPQPKALPYASESSPGPVDPGTPNSPPRMASSGTAFCVRTCDGRYFPVPATGGQTRAATCKSFCPASETKVYVGGSIDYATSADTGKSYSSLPNAFRYRTELVGGCTCNGKDSGGLAKINIQDDPTLRKGDLVAGADGALAASGGDRRNVAANHSVARSTRLPLTRLPVVAAQ